MLELPDGFVECSLTALDAAERAQLVDALAHGVAARGLRVRPGFVLDEELIPVPWAQGAFYIDADSTAGSHPLHSAGAYYLQEPSAMAAVTALDPQPGEHVLDLCAAPGGKSTQIAGLMRGEGLLVSNEIDAGRAKVLSQNVERMGVRNGIVVSSAPDKLAARWGVAFDRVLVDAPCSGEGMFRREPNACAEWTPQSPAGCAARQAHILDSAAELVLPGGVLVYSTCTFNMSENEDTITAFLARHPEFEPEEFSLPGVGTSRNGCLRLWPHCLRGEGHFVARLRRQGENPHRTLADTLTDLSTLHSLFEGITARGTIQWAGDRAWLVPEGAPPLDGIRVLRQGLELGERRGKLFFPAHAMAMAFPPERFAQAFPVDAEGAARYLRGETLDAGDHPSGWTVVAYRGLGLGLGKCTDGMIKNHLPKGLRRMK